MGRWPANDRSGAWRSSARDAPGVGPALKRLGARIRALRGQRELTQELAAEAAKLDEKHWQDIEGARTNPTVATLVGIARALEVSIAKLFEAGDDEPQPRTPPSSRKARARTAPSKRPARRTGESTR